MAALQPEKINDRIYRFHDPSSDVDAFLLLGERKAVVIDGLEQAEGLLAAARTLTDLPLEMVVAHGHPDHAGQGTKEFIGAGYPVHMLQADFPLLASYGFQYPEAAFSWLRDEQVLDLGGRTLEVAALPGHTAGSCMLWCPEERVIFASDSLGSGDIWMWLPESSPLPDYRSALEPVLDFLRDNPETRIYPGHMAQIPDYRGDGGGYMDLSYVEDLMEITTALINGTKMGRPLAHPLDMMAGVEVRSVSGKVMYAYTYDAKKTCPWRKARRQDLQCEIYPFGTRLSLKYVVVCSFYQGKYMLSRHKDRTTWETQGGHIEPGETALDAAKRELFEESGAVEADLCPVCDYLGYNSESHSYGAVFLARIHRLESLPESEMKEVRLFDTLPPELTYPQVTPRLMEEAEKILYKEGK